MRIPVLTYHPAFVGTTYASNNLVAFAEDLRQIDALGYRVLPLHRIVAALLRREDLPGKFVALTLDDGTNYDFYDLPHPVLGTQPGVFTSLRSFVDEFGPARQPWLHVTSFAIVSPQARAELDQRCLFGQGWFTHDWWGTAVESARMGIANHSWDHNHPDTTPSIPAKARGTFKSIDSFDEADVQVRKAQDFLLEVAPNPATMLFAYPYGEGSEYLRREYLPRYGPALGLRAAFSTTPRHLTEAWDIWNLPRYVFGADWTSPTDLKHLLDS